MSVSKRTVIITGGNSGLGYQSGKALADMITSDHYTGVTGKYIDRGREVKSSELSYDLQNANELWVSSGKLVGL